MYRYILQREREGDAHTTIISPFQHAKPITGDAVGRYHVQLPWKKSSALMVFS